jgi:hypothetical protein
MTRTTAAITRVLVSRPDIFQLPLLANSKSRQRKFGSENERLETVAIESFKGYEKMSIVFAFGTYGMAGWDESRVHLCDA